MSDFAHRLGQFMTENFSIKVPAPVAEMAGTGKPINGLVCAAITEKTWKQ